jgi:hypothetical protein
MKKYNLEKNIRNNKIINKQKIVLDNFSGTQYRIAHNWFSHIDLNNYKDKPINYLEVGVFYGANLLSVAKSYGLHKDSKLYCIDPWEDYQEYFEYKNYQKTIYETFINNVENSGSKEKIIINRGYSTTEIPKFDDNFFDIIYVDANHEEKYVLQDAILSFEKLKVGGMMIFDDYNDCWMGTKNAINSFISSYNNSITYLGLKDTQIFIRKNN